MPWTEEKMNELRDHWNAGLAAGAIAEKLGDGISRNAVIGKAHRLGLAARPSPVKAGDPAAIVARPGATARPARAPKPPAKPQRTTLLDLSDKVCKWPINHPGDADFHFCGKPSNAGFPYCAEHCAVAYQAQQPRRDRPNRPLPPVRVR